MEPNRAERVHEAVSALVPALGPINDISRVDVGWGNENWTADTSVGRVMVKVGLVDSSAEKWTSAGVALGLARAAGVPAPELLAFDSSNALLGGRVLRVFSYIDGFSPETLDDQPAKRTRFFGQLGEAVARLHRVAQPAFTSRIVERAERAALDRDLVAQAEAALFPRVTRLDDGARPVVCHRDLYFDNLLCDRDGNLVAILDFDMAEAWEPVADFHKLRWWVFGADREAERAFVSGYLAGEPFAHDFDERVLVVEILELVNGIANWTFTDQTAMTANAEDRLRTLLRG